MRFRAAQESDRPALEQFCRDNPGYDVFLTGEVPEPSSWAEDFLTDLPPKQFGWSATHKLIALEAGPSSTIVAVADVTEDMIAKDVAHIGLFQVAEALHGTGLAHALYQELEDWLSARGTDVIRLGVLNGNARGMSFWRKHGYLETRTRTGTAPTGKQHLSHVMFKPLKSMSLEAYSARVPRDDPRTED